MSKKSWIGYNDWLKEHIKDIYVQEAKKKGLRSRSWFKLKEINSTDRIFQSGMTVMDLGCAPGGWSQYAKQQIGLSGRIIACDLLIMEPIVGVDFLQGDLCDQTVIQALIKHVGNQKVQVVMSDMAPNITGISDIDIPRSRYLCELAFSICRDVLAPQGSFIVKTFQGKGFNEYIQQIKSIFTKIKIRKPKASRLRSREIYLVAKGRKSYV